MVTPDVVRRFLAGVGMGGRPARPETEDEDALLRRFLSSQGRLSEAPATAEDTAGVQRALASQQLRPDVEAEANPLAPARSQKLSPAAARPTEEDAEYNARRAAASRSAFATDVLAGATEGFDRATNLISGANLPIRARDARSVAEAERAFRASEVERDERERALRLRPIEDAKRLAEIGKLQADTTKAQAQAESTAADAAYETALRDINSPETQALREQAVAMSGGKITPEMARGLNGIQLRDTLKTATSQLNAEQMATLGANRLASAEKMAQLERVLRREGLDNQWDIAELMARLREEDASKDREFRAGENEKDRELRLLLAQLLADRQGQKDKNKLNERGVGGFKIKEGAFPSQDNEKQMSKVAIDSRSLKYSLDRLSSLYRQHGTELFRKYAGEMESEFMAITNLLRGINNMGVPNGRDYEMLAKEIQDPTTWKDMFTSKGRNMSKFDSLSKRIANTVSVTADVYGYEPDDGAAPPAQPADANGVTPIDSLVGNTQPPPLPIKTPVVAPPVSSPPQPPARAMAPAPNVSPGDIPRLVRTTGMKPGDLKNAIEEGETVRIAMKKRGNGGVGYRTVQKRNGKLIVIAEDKD